MVRESIFPSITSSKKSPPLISREAKSTVMALLTDRARTRKQIL